MLAIRKTEKPDYRHETFDQWKRYVSRELFHVQNKNLINQAKDLIYKPLKIQA